MDLSEPARALAPGLTVPVLRALSRRSTPATASQIWRAARGGTLAGVQRACDRLVAHGLVETDEAGGRQVYYLNHDHLLYDAAMATVAATGVLSRRMATAVERWEVPPRSAVLFGSAARGDGDVESDVDLLLVRPGKAPAAVWHRQVHDLAGAVRRWTGNRLEIVDVPLSEARLLRRDNERLFRALVDEGITLYGDDITAVAGAST